MQVKPIEIQPHGTPINTSIIWLHGLGADGNDFVPIASELDLANSQSIRFIFPTAPQRTVTINNNAVSNAWYDIKEMSLDEKVDVEGIEQSIAIVNQLVEKEIARGILPQDIILAGFSQGAVIALYTALCANKPFKGVVALSGYLPVLDFFKNKFNSNTSSTPILMQHGLFDPVVPLVSGQQAKDELIKLGYSVIWDTYSMPHSVCEQEVNKISSWVNEL